jgi:hypothetical protein
VPTNPFLSVALIILFSLACSLIRAGLALWYIRLAQAGRPGAKDKGRSRRRLVGKALLGLDYLFIFLAISFVLIIGARMRPTFLDYVVILEILVLPVCVYALFNLCFKTIRIKLGRPYVVGWAPYRRFFAPEIVYPATSGAERIDPESH